jgi:23S rRNA (cytosine1962-C5)-methyltransferase
MKAIDFATLLFHNFSKYVGFHPQSDKVYNKKPTNARLCVLLPTKFNSMSYPILFLKPKKIDSIMRRHPWVFSGALSGDLSKHKDGDKVTVADATGNVLATGHFGAGSIAVRVLEFANVQLDLKFYTKRLKRAYELRQQLGLINNDDTNGYRLVHGEGDGLPGLVVDVYANVAVIQMHSKGMIQDSTFIQQALQSIYGNGIAHFIEKRADSKREQTPKLPEGAPAGTAILEHGQSFYVDWQTGQKTGFFLDQRENRALIGQYAAGKKVLNAFSYSGGFSIYALKAGAKEVHSLDSSAKAIQLVQDHLEMNGLKESNHRSICADALEYLNGDEAKMAHYDLIVLDPPAFAKHRSARHAAVQAYKRLNARAMRIAGPGSILFTFSCSQVVTPELFNHTIAAAAIESGRTVRILHHLHQPADHPVSIFHPEGEYLKGLVLAID